MFLAKAAIIGFGALLILPLIGLAIWSSIKAKNNKPAE